MLEQILASPVLIPGVVALLTALGVKWLDSLGVLRKTRVEEAAAIRGELRGDIINLRTEVQNLEDQVSRWREKYYEQMAINMELKAQVNELSRQMLDLRNMAGDRRKRPADVVALPREHE